MKFNLYKIGFFIIFALPLFNLPPWFYPTDWTKAIVFRSILAIMLFACFTQFLKGKFKFNWYSIKNNKIIWALGGLFGVFLLASIFSVDPRFSFWGSPYRGGGLVNFFFYLIFALLAFVLIKKDNWKNAWLTAISTGIVVSLIALIQYYGLLNKIFISVESRPGSTIGNPIFLGIYLLLLLFPTLAFFIKEAKGKLKVFYAISATLFLFVILITASRAAYFGVFIGSIIFAFGYPMGNHKKISLLKTGVATFLFLTVVIVAYTNLVSSLPKLISENRILNQAISRLSIKEAFNNERYRAWITVTEAIKNRPILGWGLENVAVGFDKFYDPNITQSSWWDKAHNIFLDIGAQAGILGIIAYLLLFVALFWQLQKFKSNNPIIMTGLQSTLAGYLVANFFSFDCFPTYLLFFFIIAYISHLTTLQPATEQNNKPAQQLKGSKKITFKGLLGAEILILFLFLWQYNFVPFQINTETNKAVNLAQNGKCEASFNIFEKNIQKRSILDPYIRTKYVDSIKKCAGFNSDKNPEYAQRGIELLEETITMQPCYTRFWIYLGSFKTVAAKYETDQTAKQTLLDQAYFALDEAELLSPMHTEIFIEKTKTDVISENYQKMEQNAEKCIKIDPKLSQCYWIKAVAKIYMGNETGAKEDMLVAESHDYNIYSQEAYYYLIAVYEKIQKYDKIAEIYEKLIKMHPDQMPSKNPSNLKEYNDVAQYHASLAFAYYKLGQYQKTRQEALIFLQFMPEAKEEVEEFLKTLPY